MGASVHVQLRSRSLSRCTVATIGSNYFRSRSWRQLLIVQLPVSAIALANRQSRRAVGSRHVVCVGWGGAGEWWPWEADPYHVGAGCKRARLLGGSLEVLWCGPSASSLTTSCLPHCISRSEVESTRRRRIRHGECRHPLLTIATTDPGPHPTTTTTHHPFSRALTVTVTPTVRCHRMGLDEGVEGCERSPAPRRGNSHTLEARASCAYASPAPRRTTVIVRRSASSISLPAVKRSVVATRSASIGTTLPPSEWGAEEGEIPVNRIYPRFHHPKRATGTRPTPSFVSGTLPAHGDEVGPLLTDASGALRAVAGRRSGRSCKPKKSGCMERACESRSVSRRNTSSTAASRLGSGSSSRPSFSR